MAKFKALTKVYDKKEDNYINKDDVVERTGKRANDFKNSPYFSEIEENIDLNKLKKAELQKIADEKGIKYSDNDTKDALIKAIEDNK